MSLYVCTYFPFLVRVHVFSPPCTCARITTIPYFVLDAMVSYFEKGNTTVVWIQLAGLNGRVSGYHNGRGSGAREWVTDRRPDDGVGDRTSEGVGDGKDEGVCDLVKE
jgi:hypothetical protein